MIHLLNLRLPLESSSFVVNSPIEGDLQFLIFCETHARIDFTDSRATNLMNIEPLGYTAKSAHVQGVVSG